MSFTHINRRQAGDFAPKIKATPPKGIENDEAMRYYELYKSTGDYSYRNMILNGCLRRIQWAVSQMCDEGSVAVEDLMQEATIGFLNGIDKYDPVKATTARGTIKIYNFCLTYARKAVYEFYETNGHNIRIPAPVKRALSQLGKRTEAAIKEHGNENVAPDALYYDKHPFIRAGVITHQQRTNIVDPMNAVVASLKENTEHRSDKQLILSAAQALPEPQRGIFMSHFGLSGDSKKSVAKKSGYSPEEMERVVNACIAKIRRVIVYDESTQMAGIKPKQRLFSKASQIALF